MNGVNDAMILRRFAQKMAATNVPDDPEAIRKMFAGGQAPAPDLQDRVDLAVRGTPGPLADVTVNPVVNAVKSTGQAAGKAISDHMPAMDLSTIGQGVGGAALGGLGAMGLARLFQSEKEKERGRVPMLAGLAGAGAGAIGLPLLLQYLASGSGKNPALAAADMHIASPGADVGALQRVGGPTHANIA